MYIRKGRGIYVCCECRCIEFVFGIKNERYMYYLFVKFMWFFVVKYVKEVIVNGVVIGFYINVYIIV